MPRRRPSASRAAGSRPERPETPAPSSARKAVVRQWMRSPWAIVAGFAVFEVFLVAIGLPSWLDDRHRAEGQRLARERRYEEAIAPYEKLLKKYPGSPTVNLELGLTYLNARRYNEAVDRLGFLAAQPEPPSGVHSKLGQAYEALGESEKAMMEFNAAVEEDPKDPIANYYLGERLYRNGHLMDAVKLLERAAFHPEVGPRAQQLLKEIEKRIFADTPASRPR
ncbi:MAG: tetratricopeptide repeat protein [Candidatus Sumerlaeota bacterium]|nr:tetratricopeptide repeat protein [Candidatus Sumerlaeota bacterium]